MSTHFRTASFYYDFHLLTVFRQVTAVGGGAAVGSSNLNLSWMLHHLQEGYRRTAPPKHATNFVGEMGIEVEMDSNLQRGHEREFFPYLYDNCKDYGFNRVLMNPADPESQALYLQNKASEIP